MTAPWTGGSDPGSQRPSVDGDHTIADPVGNPLVSFPFEGDSFAPLLPSYVVDLATNGYITVPPDASQAHPNSDDFILEQEFTIAADYFSPLALNTPYDQANYAPTYAGSLTLSDAVLIAESPPRDIGNGVVAWRRTYATLPKSRNGYESCPFTFPGIAATVAWVPNFDFLTFGMDPVQISDGAPEVSEEVTVRVQRDFYLLETGQSPENVIPIIRQFAVYVGTVVFGQSVGIVFDEDLLANGNFQDLAGASVSAPFSKSIPSKTEYLETIAAKEICVKSSAVRQWRGNIYERTTYFTIAQ